MKVRIETDEVVDAVEIKRLSPISWSAAYVTYRLPDGRTFSGYNDRLGQWRDPDGVLNIRNVDAQAPEVTP